MTDMDEAMAQAVDIGENDDEGGDDSEVEEEEEEEEEKEEEEKITRNWSVYKTTPQAPESKNSTMLEAEDISFVRILGIGKLCTSILHAKPKKEGPLSLEEAIDDSENLTDFLMDFEQDE
ncbi:unnamed protein product [Dovyalis caffra]|uniref:Uncharacterized protein n=1 Tax=Dovyalis caffra TaxID=77055 RepID=A0AAV1SJU1_9ROSI|nr:unnamed protein product [Dovyalis caffra]